MLRFLTQASLAVAGAACLWGYVFSRKAATGDKNKKKYWDLSAGLFFLFAGSFSFFVVGWWFMALFVYPTLIYGHEGVVHTTQDFIRAGFQAGLPIVVLATITGFAGILAFIKKAEYFKGIAHKFFAVQFILLSVILALSSYTGTVGRLQLSYILHNWHSIITLGTVVVVDFLFLYTLHKDSLKRVLYPAYPVMSAFIWIGLGMDFISSGLFNNFDPIHNTQFVFNQIVIAIIIMNGALLSVYLNDAFTSLIKKTKVNKPSEALEEIVRISGSVSIVSWVTITFLDFTRVYLDLNYLFAIYMGLIALAYLLKPAAEKSASKLFA
ncbi:MAG: hypothetical protein WDZ40_04550 [Candidatus Spechtbacterales bacterium]